jgi:hypothetical protein
MAGTLTPGGYSSGGVSEGGEVPMAGGRRRGATAKQLKRMLKKAGLKTTGRKAALTRRAKKAHLKMGGAANDESDGCPKGQQMVEGKCEPITSGGRRRSRKSKSKGFKLY